VEAAIWVSAAALAASLLSLLTATFTVLLARREHEKLFELALRERDAEASVIEPNRLFAMVYVVERAIRAAQSAPNPDPSQAWFWTPEWQAGEREADADLAAGHTQFFESEDGFFAALDGIPAKDGLATGPGV
jgi:hypothetical protein